MIIYKYIGNKNKNKNISGIINLWIKLYTCKQV